MNQSVLLSSMVPVFVFGVFWCACIGSDRGEATSDGASGTDGDLRDTTDTAREYGAVETDSSSEGQDGDDNETPRLPGELYYEWDGDEWLPKAEGDCLNSIDASHNTYRISGYLPEEQHTWIVVENL